LRNILTKSINQPKLYLECSIILKSNSNIIVELDESRFSNNNFETTMKFGMDILD